jgi:hypothetical protein
VLGAFELDGVTASVVFCHCKSIDGVGEGFGDGRGFKKLPIPGTESQPSKMSSLNIILLLRGVFDVDCISSVVWIASAF